MGGLPHIIHPHAGPFKHDPDATHINVLDHLVAIPPPGPVIEEIFRHTPFPIFTTLRVIECIGHWSGGNKVGIACLKFQVGRLTIIGKSGNSDTLPSQRKVPLKHHIFIGQHTFPSIPLQAVERRQLQCLHGEVGSIHHIYASVAGGKTKPQVIAGVPIHLLIGYPNKSGAVLQRQCRSHHITQAGLAYFKFFIGGPLLVFRHKSPVKDFDLWQFAHKRTQVRLEGSLFHRKHPAIGRIY